MTIAISDYKDGFSFTGLTSSYQSGVAGPFTLKGGTYSLQAVDTGSINASVTMLNADGSTYSTLVSALSAATVGKIIQVPPCSVKVVLGTGTSLSASLIRVPLVP